MDLTTLGMLILDSIHHPPNTIPPVSYNVLGGAGTYAVIGARLFRPNISKQQAQHARQEHLDIVSASRRIGWVVHRGNDFPSLVADQIDAWGTSVRWIETPERQTTRAVNEYIPGRGEGFRSFRYTTAKIRLDETHLTDDMLRSKAFHMVCSPERCVKLVDGIRAGRRRLDCVEEALFIWEPVPDSCDTNALQAVKVAALHVDIVSPNLSELAALFVETETVEQENERMEERCLDILDGRFGKQGGALVIRCGSQGCYIRSNKESRMLPAYWTGSEASTHVVDPTGGGNVFLGALSIGMQSQETDLELASFSKLERGAIFGNVAASFAVEQIGVPILTVGSEGEELWNGVSVPQRLSEYIARLQSSNP